MAQGLGADVTILEVDLERMRFLDITLHTAHTLYSNEAHLMELLPTVDLLIGAVLVPGAKAPKLIRREMLRRMRPDPVTRNRFAAPRCVFIFGIGIVPYGTCWAAA